MNPYFSILVPVFNQVGLMDDCIKSLLAQEFTDFEVLLVDDGSTDDSLKMCNELAEKDARFKVLKHDGNKSLLVARYTGMENAKGEYILFVDSDDYVENDSLIKLHEFLAENPVDIVRFGFYNEKHAVDPGENWVLPENTKDVVDDFLYGRIVPNVWKNCYSAAVIKEALKRVKPFYCNMSEDVFWSMVLFTCAKSEDILQENLYHYNIGTGMSTGHKSNPAKIRRDFDSMIAVEEHLHEYVDKYCPQYKEGLNYHMKRAMRYIFISGVWWEDDFSKVMDMLYEIRNEKTMWLYEEVCNEAIVVLVRKKLDLSDEKLDKIGVPHEPFTWFD